MAVHQHAPQQSSIYAPESATLVRAERLTEFERFFEIRLDSGKDLGHQPGQFVEITLPGIGEAPISISSSPDLTGSFELVVRKVGRVTAALHHLQPGGKLGVRGPFGTTFPVADVFRGRDLLFICGGIGLVPVRSAINYVLNRRADYGEVTVLYGCKTPADRLFLPELEAWAARRDITFAETVDRGDAGWTGHVGVITTLLPKISVDPARTEVVVCGPPVMYKFVLLELANLKVPDEHVYVSLERRMKCGVGKCGHCQINGLYTCLDGPVFTYRAVAGAPEAISMARPRVAIFDFACCEGCQLQLVNLEEEILGLLSVVEPVEWREAISDQSDEYDIAIIEGSITRPEDEARLQVIRERAQVLVALGACATMGGVNKLKNRYPDLQEVKDIVYGKDARQPQLATAVVKAVSEVVKVDYEIPGCPINAKEFGYIVRCLALGTEPVIPDYPVCVECRMRETRCRYELGEICLGPIIRAGCNAPCPAAGFFCFGCRGLADNPNVGAAAEIMAKYDKTVDDLRSRLWLFNTNQEKADV